MPKLEKHAASPTGQSAAAAAAMASSGYKHGDTPKRAMVRGVISYLEAQGLPVNKSAIFRHFGLSRSQGYAALSIPASKRNDPEWEETRGRPSKISDDDQNKMELILWDPKYEHVNLNWSGLAKEAGCETNCNVRTLHRTMGTIGYRRCLGCGRCWTHKRTREKRVDHASRMMELYPQALSWRFVRFSGELHFGFGLDGKMRLIPRPGERTCESCEQQQQQDGPDGGSSGGGGGQQWQRDIRKLHAWAAIGYGFKSDLVFYEESTNPNCPGILTMNDYRTQVLEKTVKSWLQATGSQSFILEEDIEGFAHGGASKVNPVQQWKQGHALRSHFNCGDSPDLSPLDVIWPPNKQWTMEPLKDWEDDTLKEAAREAWRTMVNQDRVNMWVDFMPQRLRAVIESEGRLVAW